MAQQNLSDISELQKGFFFMTVNICFIVEASFRISMRINNNSILKRKKHQTNHFIMCTLLILLG
jgi:hypothetical protein